MEQIKESLKQEAYSGISRIIVKIFEVIVEPILFGIELLKFKVKDIRDKIKSQRTMKFAINAGILAHYLDEHNFDCMVFDLRNGEDSITGLNMKYIIPYFNHFAVQPTNEYVLKLLNHKCELSLFQMWLFYSLQRQHFTIGNDYKMRLYFGNYKKVFFRKHSNKFYIVMSDGEMLTDENEIFINNVLDFME